MSNVNPEIPEQNNNPTSLNIIANAIASEQGIEINSTLWLSGGLAAFSGQTGGHSAYGFSHKHKLSPQWVKAVFANYFNRRCFYDNEPYRQSGYNIAGRPVGWKPEVATDIEAGDAVYLTSKGFVKVSGPDPQHFHIGPLVEIWDADAYTVQALGQTHSAKVLAGEAIKYLMASFAGMTRKPNGSYSSYGDRGVANLLKAINQAGRRGLLFPNDLETFMDWLRKNGIPDYTNAPGHGFSHKDFYSVPSKLVFQTYNGLWWLLPSMYDSLETCKAFNLTEFIPGLEKIVLRMSNWMLNILDHSGDFTVEQIEVDKSISLLPESPMDLTPYIVSVKKINWYEHWAFRAVSVAAHVLNNEKLKAEEAKIKLKFKGVQKEWMVDYKGEYV
jgi:hypothetical protein